MTIRFLLLSALCAVCLLVGCKKTDSPVAVVSQKDKVIALLSDKNWKLKQIKEATTTVYVDGRSDNIVPGYRQYEQRFTGGRIRLTEFTGEVFEGSWTVVESGAQLTLLFQNLTPAPSGTGGTIDYNLTLLSDQEIQLTATKGNLKTGSTINSYVLIAK